MPKYLSEEERVFISDLYGEGLRPSQIIKRFEEKFGRRISNSTVSKYARYKSGEIGIPVEPDIVEEEEEIKEVKEEPKPRREEKVEMIYIKTKDTRKKKKIIDFSDGNISDEDLKLVAKIRGTNIRETFNFLKRCYQHGLTKVNLETGEVY